MRTAETSRTVTPLLAPFLALGLGMAAAAAVPNGAWVVGSSALSGLVWLCAEWRNRPYARSLFLLFVAAVGAAVLTAALPQWQWPADDVQLSGQVLAVEPLTYYQRTIVRVDRGGILLAVHLPLEQKAAVGAAIQFSGRITAPEPAGNPGEFSYRRYLAARGIFGVCRWPEQVTVDSGAEPWAVRSWLAGLRTRIAANLSRSRAAFLLEALVLGNREHLPSSLAEAWQQLGIRHLLAISGMHIGLAALAVWWVARRLPLSERAQLVFVLVPLLLYVLVTGSRPSAWRAFAAAALTGWAKLRQQSLDGLHIWSSSGILFLSLRPWLVLDLGFQLSFAASGGLLLWLPAISRVRLPCTLPLSGLLERLCRMLLISLAAQSMLLPLLASTWQEWQPLSAVMTLWFLPLAWLALGYGMLLSFLPLPGLLLRLGDELIIGYLRLGEAAAEWLTPLSLPAASLPLSAGWWLLLACVGWLLRRPALFARRMTRSRLLILLLAVTAVLSLPPSLLYPLEVTLVDVGQGDAVLLRTPYRQHVLIDGGGDSVYWQWRGRDVGRQRLVPYLQRRGIDHLDLVVLTHPHEDHLHGLLAVLELLSIGMVVDNGEPHTTRSYRRYAEHVYQSEWPYARVTAGDSLQLHGLRLEVVHPLVLMTGTRSDLNNNSVVLRTTYRGRTLLFTGDLEQEGQRELLQRGVDPVDWLKVPHHGAEGAWFGPFYEALNPAKAAISVGSNSFGHPHAVMLDGLTEQGIAAYRTDEQGALTFYVWHGWLFGPIPRGWWR